MSARFSYMDFALLISLIPATANMIAVGVSGLFNKQAAGPAECCLVVRSGGTDHDGSNFSPPAAINISKVSNQSRKRVMGDERF